MSKRLFLLTCSILLLVGSQSLIAVPVGVFDFGEDIGRDGGNPGSLQGYGSVQYVATDEYLINASGRDFWDNRDGGFFAYNQVTGNQKLTFEGGWNNAPNGWSKYGAMIRNGEPGNIAQDAAHYFSLTRRAEDLAYFQGRHATGDNTSSIAEIAGTPIALGIQRVTVGAWTIIQGLADFGSGWELVGSQAGPAINDEYLLGIAVTSHRNDLNDGMAQAVIKNVQYSSDPKLLGVTTIGGDLKGAECPDVSGFAIKNVVAGAGSDLNGDRYLVAFPKAEWLIENENLGGIPAASVGVRLEEFVNLHDTGGRGVFDNDQSFPGMDPFEQPTVDPAGGDDESHFATEASGCIELTAGLHVIGGHGDDGIEIWIGGVLIGQSAGWNDQSDFMFLVEEAGMYSFRAIFYEVGGGADFEIWYTSPDGSRVLLNDVANGSPAVHIPEPATIALLGFGGLSMLRIRRKRAN